MSSGAAGWDLSALCAVEVAPGDRKLVPLGLALELPYGCYGRIAPRSSLAVRGIDVAGGVIDSDYRGEVKVILVNHGQEALRIDPGDRIAQLILERCAKVDLVTTTALAGTQRGDGGFGSTGVAARRIMGAPSDLPGSSATEASRGGGGQGSEAVQVMPTHVFFEGVHFARSGESMVEFVQRLRQNDLHEFQWMFPDVLFEHLQPDRLHGSSRTYLREIGQGTMRIQVHMHPEWRKKLYDSEAFAPAPEDGLTGGVVSLGWMQNGGMFARVDNRRGSRSMCYLKEAWKGVSLFFSWNRPRGGT